MAKKHLLSKPHIVLDSKPLNEAWYYEDTLGINIYVEGRVEFPLFIPWSTLRASLKRKDKPKKEEVQSE